MKPQDLGATPPASDTDNAAVIRVNDLGKCYQIYDRPQDRLWQSLWRGRKTFFREFWALRAVSFAVKKGETVGIIGRNGSGKSTLLHLIAGTLSPSTGELAVNGRIAALLELGSGFNPEFTGRENVYMNAAILGLNHDEIDRRFDEIAAFADIGDFIEQPVKTYSSGMMIRLAFAVSVCVDPEILIVDEALAVGDELFQRKCYGRIQSLQQNGTAILFVSHAAGAILELCSRAILLDSGQKLLEDHPKAVVGAYHKLLYAPAERRREIREMYLGQTANTEARPTKELPISLSPTHYDSGLIPESTVVYEHRGAQILDPHLESLNGQRVNILGRGEEYIFAYDVLFDEDAFAVRYGMLIKTKQGIELCSATSSQVGEGDEFVAAGLRMRINFRFRCSLLPGLFFLNAGCGGIIQGEEGFLHRIEDAVAFRVPQEAGLLVGGLLDLEISHQHTLLD